MYNKNNIINLIFSNILFYTTRIINEYDYNFNYSIYFTNIPIALIEFPK